MIPRIPEEARRHHRELSLAAERFLDFAEANPDCWERLSLAGAGLPQWVLDYPYTLQPWPTLAGPEKLSELRAITLRIVRLIKSVPERVFGNDAAEIARFYRLPSAGHARIALLRPNGIASAVARSDTMLTTAGYRFLEVNMTSRLGGWQLRFFAKTLLRAPWMRRFLAETGIEVTFESPVRALFEHLVDEAVAAGLCGDGEIHISFLADHGFIAAIRPLEEFFQTEVDALLAETGRLERGFVTMSTADELREEPGGLSLAGRRIHVVYDFDEHQMKAILLKALKAGVAQVYNGSARTLLNDKRNLALLSEHVDRFEEEDRRFIDTYVPWSRWVRRGGTDHSGETVSLPGFLIARREELVLKKGFSFGGHGVRAGWATAPEEWERLVEQAVAEGDWMAQERQRPLPLWYQHGPSGGGPHDVIWGTFAFGQKRAGGFIRMARQGTRAVINSAKGADEGLLLGVPE